MLLFLADVDCKFIRYTVKNAGPNEATLHFLQNIWFRNTWAWADHEGMLALTVLIWLLIFFSGSSHHNVRPTITHVPNTQGIQMNVHHADLGDFVFLAEKTDSLELFEFLRL